MSLTDNPLSDICSRVTSAWSFDANGDLKEYTANVPIEVFNGEKSGLLTHGNFTNLLAQSNGQTSDYNTSWAPVQDVAGFKGISNVLELNKDANQQCAAYRVVSQSDGIDGYFVAHYVVQVNGLQKPVLTGETTTDSFRLYMMGATTGNLEILWEQDLGDGVWYYIVRRLRGAASNNYVGINLASNSVADWVKFQVVAVTEGPGWVPAFPWSDGTTTVMGPGWFRKIGSDITQFSLFPSKCSGEFIPLSIATESTDLMGGFFGMQINGGTQQRLNFGVRGSPTNPYFYAQIFGSNGTQDSSIWSINAGTLQPEFGVTYSVSLAWDDEKTELRIDDMVFGDRFGDFVTGTSRNDIIIGSAIGTARRLNCIVKSFAYEVTGNPIG